MMHEKNMAAGEQGYKIDTKSKCAKLFAQVSDIGPSWSSCIVKLGFTGVYIIFLISA